MYSLTQAGLISLTPAVGRLCRVSEAICSTTFPLTVNMAPDKGAIFLGRLDLNPETIDDGHRPFVKRVSLKSVVANLCACSGSKVEAPSANRVGQFHKALSLQTTRGQLAVENFVSDVSRVIKGWPEFTVRRPYHVFNRCAI